MKTFILFFLPCLVVFQLQGQHVRTEYDATLAESMGADDYGMRSYVLVMLKTGSNKTDEKATIDSLFAGHMKNMVRLADEGKLIVAGPLGRNDKSYRGIFILDTKNIEEAKTLLQTDPAVKATLLDYELYDWYGSAALPVYLETHKKIQKLDF